MSLSVCFTCLSTYVSVYLLYLSGNICFCLSSLPVCHRMFRSICFTCLLTYVSVYLLYLSAYVRLPINVCLRLSICFTFLSSYVSVCPHTHTRTHARTHARTHVRTLARTHSMPSSNHWVTLTLNPNVKPRTGALSNCLSSMQTQTDRQKVKLRLEVASRQNGYDLGWVLKTSHLFIPVGNLPGRRPPRYRGHPERCHENHTRKVSQKLEWKNFNKN